MASQKTSPKILLFPMISHGHINPFVELARNLTKNNFVVYLCSTPVNLKKFAKKLDDYSIRQVEYHLPSSPELPPHCHTTNGLPRHLVYPLIHALHNSGPTFSDILKSVQPDLVIHDINQTFIPHIPKLYDIPSIYFQVFGCAPLTYHMHQLKRPDIQFPSTALFYREHEINNTSQQLEPQTKYKDMDEDQIRMNCVEQSNEIILSRSSRALEQKYIDFQSSLLDKKMVPVGSLVSDPIDDVNDDSKVMQWLSGKEEASTLYVSFGSEIFLSKEEVKEIALGLEMSNVNFIWVVRSPYGQKLVLEEVMPEGFLDRIKGKGFVEDDWAPQTKILKHPNIGAFVSHCGWGSVVESISFGVPVVAMPVQFDQPLNARLVVELGVGLEVVGEESGMWKREEIARIIDQMMLKDEGEAIRRKAKELGKKVRAESQEEIDVAMQELRRMCQKKNYQS